MSFTYADGLSECEDKGVCGLEEIHDDLAEVEKKIDQVAEMIRQAKHIVVHTGAGISTSAGIPDFRGPRGVWTLEKQGHKPDLSTSFDEAKPTFTHMALVALEQAGFIHFIISQNIDGLHLKSNFPYNKLAELHGNMFLKRCDQCQRQFIHKEASKTVGQKSTGEPCPIPKSNGRICRGKLHDTILDWEHELPGKDLEMSDEQSRKADLSISLGTTLQIVPSGNLPLLTKKSGGKFVICNLQPTKHDKHADFIIHDYVDNVMGRLVKLLGVEVPEYKPSTDPTMSIENAPKEYRRTKSGKRARQTKPKSEDLPVPIKKECSIDAFDKQLKT